MSFVVSITEKFRGGPNARTEQTNMSGSFTFYDKNELLDYIEKDISQIYRTKNVIRKTWLMERDQLVCILLFERPGKHGRLLRIYTVIKEHKQDFSEFWSLV